MKASARLLVLLPVEPTGIAGKVQLFIVKLASADFPLSVDFQDIPGEYTDRFRLPQVQARILQPFSQDIFRAGVDVQTTLREVVDGQRVIALNEIQFIFFR